MYLLLFVPVYVAGIWSILFCSLSWTLVPRETVTIDEGVRNLPNTRLTLLVYFDDGRDHRS